MIALPGNLTAEPFWSALRVELQILLQTAQQIIVPILGVVIVVAIMAHFFQYGLLLSFKALQPSMKKLNPASNIKNIVGKKNLLEFLKSLLKVILLSLLITMVIRDSIDPLLKSPICGGPCVQAALATMLKQIVIFSSAAFIVLAAADYLIEKRLYLKELMMSKDEVKREYKEMEGDPHIKGKRKQLHQELINEDTVQKARKATVIVTNPTEVAVALYYQKDETPLPVVLAKAKDVLARRIIEVAREEGIPI